jgi:Alcohol dehydrogenase transcription factor Myb/SANT-like.
MKNKIQFANTTSVHRALQTRQMHRMWKRENTLTLIEDLHSFPCLWDVKQRSTKTVTRKVMHMILWLKAAVEIEKKIQVLKTHFHREHKELVDSKRSGVSPKKAV